MLRFGKPYSISDPKVIDLKKWRNAVLTCLMVEYGKIFAYIINKKAFDIEYVSQYKPRRHIRILSVNLYMKFFHLTLAQIKLFSRQKSHLHKRRGKIPGRHGFFAQKEAMSLWLTVHVQLGMESVVTT